MSKNQTDVLSATNRFNVSGRTSITLCLTVYEPEFRPLFFSPLSPHIIVLYHINIIYIYCLAATAQEDELRVRLRLRASEHVRRVGLTAVKLGPYWTTIGRVIYSGTMVGREGGVGEWARARVSQKWHLRAAAAAVVTVKGPLVAADVTNRRQSLIKSRLSPARRRPFRGPTTLCSSPACPARPHAKG